MLHKFHRTDTNDSEIVNILLKLGAEVVDLSQCGRGIPDKLVWFKNRYHLIEIKYRGPLGWKYTPAQQKFRKRYAMPIVTLDNVEDTIKWAKNVTRGTEDK